MKSSLGYLSFLFYALAAPAFAEDATILLQADAPLQIVNYTNRYKAPDRVGDGTITHRATVENVSGQDIEGYGLGFYVFDSFNRDLARPFVGYAMTTLMNGSKDQPGWEQRPNSAFLFRNHGQGIAYVDIVRLADGTIWQADSSSITRQLEDFELTLTMDER